MSPGHTPSNLCVFGNDILAVFELSANVVDDAVAPLRRWRSISTSWARLTRLSEVGCHSTHGEQIKGAQNGQPYVEIVM